ncbi:hypothetical protein G6F57_021319 [Rhizopus arrhizus]|nr:hypothetical protein G6F57_021319 [Rhizopus arrhizus]
MEVVVVVAGVEVAVVDAGAVVPKLNEGLLAVVVAAELAGPPKPNPVKGAVVVEGVEVAAEVHRTQWQV